MKIKINKNQWEKIGEVAGWMKVSNFERCKKCNVPLKTDKEKTDQVCKSCSVPPEKKPQVPLNTSKPMPIITPAGSKDIIKKG